jgi:hypothetical protein
MEICFVQNVVSRNNQRLWPRVSLFVACGFIVPERDSQTVKGLSLPPLYARTIRRSAQQ